MVQDYCKLKILQIYYDDNSLKNCFNSSFVTKVKNEKLTPFFENSIILNEVPKMEAQYIGVFSHAFSQKIIRAKHMSPEYLSTKLDKDIVSFFENKNTRNVFTLAESYHKDITKIFEAVCEKIGYDPVLMKMKTKRVVYQNHFIARKEVYLHYIDEVLRPAMELMEDKNSGVHHILWSDSRYHKKKKLSAYLEKQLGVPYYPYHTFVCERLLSLFLQKHNYTFHYE